MKDKVIDFPQYRKLSNDKTYYRIHSTELFEEIMIIGEKAVLYTIEAKQYPEMLRIKDMIQLNGFELSTKEEFDSRLEQFGLK